jgi:ribosomal protein L11 methyltransferase
MYCWFRQIKDQAKDTWSERLAGCGEQNVVLIESPRKKGVRLEVYLSRKSEALRIQQKFGGTIAPVMTKKWLKVTPRRAIRVASDLMLFDSVSAREAFLKKSPETNTLVIPAGLAFGTGEHATTGMMLRALSKQMKEPPRRFLDVGTGSGIFALAARAVGVKDVTAIDFDPIAIRVAKENERINFRTGKIHWAVVDILKWKARGAFEVIAANLFSELLIASAERIWGFLKPGGTLFLSGILKSQANEVRSRFRKLKAKEIAFKRKGKWVMVVYRKP